MQLTFTDWSLAMLGDWHLVKVESMLCVIFIQGAFIDICVYYSYAAVESA